MLKKTAEQIAVTLLTFYFIFDSLQKLLDNQHQTWLLNHKSQQIETSLSNKGILLFQFASIIDIYGSLITFSIGLIQLIGAIGTLLVEESDNRLTFIQLLLLCLLFDSSILHMPFTELEREQERELMHFSCNIAIGGALLMAGGLRDLS